MKKFLSKHIIKLVIVLMLLFWVVYALLFYKNYIDAGRMFRTAKNIQLSMRLLSIQYYGEDRDIYSPNTMYGMDKDTINEIKDLSGANGDIILIAWDSQKGIPTKFYYEEELFMVQYEYNYKNNELEWKVWQMHSLIERGFH